MLLCLFALEISKIICIIKFLVLTLHRNNHNAQCNRDDWYCKRAFRVIETKRQKKKGLGRLFRADGWFDFHHKKNNLSAISIAPRVFPQKIVLWHPWFTGFASSTPYAGCDICSDLSDCHANAKRGTRGLSTTVCEAKRSWRIQTIPKAQRNKRRSPRSCAMAIATTTIRVYLFGNS